MKKIIIASTLTLGLFGLSACGDSASSDPDVVVETSAGDVTKDEFYNELKDAHGAEVLSTLVTMKILEDKYEVSDERIDEEMKNIEEQVGDNFKETLEAQGLTEDDLRRDIKNGLLQEAAITDGVEVSDEEIEQYFDRQKYSIEAQHVLVSDKKLADKVYKEAQDEKDFSKLAEKYSTDEQSAMEGGELPPFSAGEMVSEFEDAVFSMKEGEISKPVESEHGFHVIKLIKKTEKDEDFGKLEDSKEEIRREIAQSKVDQEEAVEKLGNIMKDTDIKVKIKQFEDLFQVDEAEAPEVQEEKTDE